jgi:hypothetical protein
MDAENVVLIHNAVWLHTATEKNEILSVQQNGRILSYYNKADTERQIVLFLSHMEVKNVSLNTG